MDQHVGPGANVRRRIGWIGLRHSPHLDQLLTQLQDAKTRFKGEQQFETAVGSLVAVVDFLNAEPKIADQGLTEPLKALIHASTNLLNCAPSTKQKLPALFRQSRPHRQQDGSEDGLKGAALHVIDVLHGRGASILEACEHVSSAFAAFGIIYRAQALEQLRDTIGAGRSKKATIAAVRQQLNDNYSQYPLSADVQPRKAAAWLVGAFLHQYGDPVGSHRARGWRSKRLG